jgi:hypothetical protein
MAIIFRAAARISAGVARAASALKEAWAASAMPDHPSDTVGRRTTCVVPARSGSPNTHRLPSKTSTVCDAKANRISKYDAQKESGRCDRKDAAAEAIPCRRPNA